MYKDTAMSSIFYLPNILERFLPTIFTKDLLFLSSCRKRGYGIMGTV